MSLERPAPWLLLAGLLLAAACGGGGGGGPADGGSFIGYLPDDGDPGGTDPGGGSPTAPALRLLDRGEMSHVTASRTWTARNQAEYDALWAAHRLPGTVAQPPVDFSAEIVVAVFLGQRASSGYGVELVAATPDGTGALVLWNETYPGAGCPPGLPVVTHPYAIAAMTRVEGAVHYAGDRRAVPCP